VVELLGVGEGFGFAWTLMVPDALAGLAACGELPTAVSVTLLPAAFWGMAIDACNSTFWPASRPPTAQLLVPAGWHTENTGFRPPVEVSRTVARPFVPAVSQTQMAYWAVVPAWTVLPLSDWTERQSVPEAGGDEDLVGVGVAVGLAEDDLVGEGLGDGSGLLGDGLGELVGDGCGDWLGGGWDVWLGDAWGDWSGLGEALELVGATGLSDGLGEADDVCPALAVHAVRLICDPPPRAAVLFPCVPVLPRAALPADAFLTTAAV
jgi:hypothetical protein